MCIALPLILMTLASLLGWLIGRDREEVEIDTSHYDTTISGQTTQIANLQSKYDEQVAKYKTLDTKFYNTKNQLNTMTKPETVSYTHLTLPTIYSV